MNIGSADPKGERPGWGVYPPSHWTHILVTGDEPFSWLGGRRTVLSSNRSSPVDPLAPTPTT
jgi:hypothetical protein